jgi:hypothetical protein
MKAEEGKSSPKDWTPSEQQAKVLAEATRAGFRQSVRRVAQRAGVPCRTVYNWLGKGTPGEDPGFKLAWSQLWPEAFKVHIPGIMAALVKKARDGDVSAIKLVAEMGGHYVPKQETTHHHDVAQTIRDSYQPKEPAEEQDDVQPPQRGELKKADVSGETESDPPTPGDDGGA